MTMTDMKLWLKPEIMSDKVKREMDAMLDGNSTYKEIVAYLAENAIITSETAIARYADSRRSRLFNRLMKDIECAKRSKSRELLYEAYEAAIMARELNAVSHEEFMELNTAAVRNGLNNAEIWRGVEL